jgi:hypothetical protein
MHEIGHTPIASMQFGYAYRPNFNWKNEFDIVNHVENPFREYLGIQARNTYGGVAIPPSP